MEKDTRPSAVISPFLSDHIIGKAANELADDIKFPRQTANLAALTTASHAVGSCFTVSYPDGSPLPIPLFTLAEQPSGTGKTNLMLKLYQGYAEEAYKINKEIHKEREQVKRSISQKIKQGIEVHENEQSKLESLKDIPTGTTDATPQSLEKLMDQYGGYFLAYGTEQNLTDTLLGGLYSEGKKVDGIINSAFNGEYHRTTRAGNERVTFQGRPFGGIFCLSQGGTIQTVLESAGSSGLTERFLIIREDDLLGTRGKYPELSDKEVSDILTMRIEPPNSMLKKVAHINPMTAYKQYKAQMARMARIRSKTEDVELTGLKRLEFEPDAWAMIEAAKEMFERNIANQKVRNSFLASMNSKIDILVMKCAATIHVMDCAEYQDIGKITRESVFSAFATVNALFEGVGKIADGNQMYGDNAEDLFIIEYLSSKKTVSTMEEIKRNVKRRKDSPFRFFTKHGESAQKIEESVNRLSENGKIFTDKRRTPWVYSA